MMDQQEIKFWLISALWVFKILPTVAKFVIFGLNKNDYDQISSGNTMFGNLMQWLLERFTHISGTDIQKTDLS